MKTYGQYCPIARASELLAERWTPILVRNLLAGCRTFGELIAGAPGISRALLAQRLELLEQEGIVRKETVGAGRGRCFYAVTEKGRELKSVTDALGRWGARWLEVEPQHADPVYVLWATSRLVDPARIPSRGLIVRFELRDCPGKNFWLVIRRPRAEVCTSYPGQEEDVRVTSDSRTIALWHLRRLTLEEATRSNRLRIEGPHGHVKAFLDGLRPSPFATRVLAGHRTDRRRARR